MGSLNLVMADGGARWVVFDIGGVLAHVARDWGDALREAGETPGRPEAWTAHLEAFDEFLGYQAGRDDLDAYLDALTRFLGIDDRNRALRVHQSILMRPFDGTVRLVDDLHALGYRTGVLSNTNAPHWDVLLDPARYPAIAAVQAPHASHLLGLDKPDPAIYRAFEAAVGATPDQIAFFDDNARNIESALACGWHAVLKSPDEDTVAAVWAACAGRGWPTPASPAAARP